MLHDLHESVPFLYVSTGMGPYNAWLDPLVVDEWQKMAYVEIEEMTKRGVPGVWTHGFYDGWAPNYMFYVANGHNSIGRFYETFGGNGADSGVRTVPANATSRTWFRPNPPLPNVNWSIRNNINLQESGLLFAMNYTANNRKQFLDNFYLKSKRSVAKAAKEGPAAWVIPADDPRPGECRRTGEPARASRAIEVHRLNADAEVTIEAAARSRSSPQAAMSSAWINPTAAWPTCCSTRSITTSAIRAPYDDTGWTLGAAAQREHHARHQMRHSETPMTLLTPDAKPAGGISGPSTAAAYLINHNTDNTLATLRFRLKDVKMLAAEEAFKAGGHRFQRRLVHHQTRWQPRGHAHAPEQPRPPRSACRYSPPRKRPPSPTHALAAPADRAGAYLAQHAERRLVPHCVRPLKIPYEYISDQKLKRYSRSARQV